ncbi:hypothetical protein HK100_006016, partial [Physocladia obscura]
MARKFLEIYNRLRESRELANDFKRDRGMEFYFHCVSLSTLNSSWQGRTEKNAEDIFYHIPKKFGISVILLDEVDSILGKSPLSEGTNTMEQITKSFQALIQGGHPEIHWNTFILATSNMKKSELNDAWVQRFGHKSVVDPPKTVKQLDNVIQCFWKGKMKELHSIFYFAPYGGNSSQSSISHQKDSCEPLQVDNDILQQLVDRQTVPRDIETVMSDMSNLRARRVMLDRGDDIISFLCKPEDFFHQSALNMLKSKDNELCNEMIEGLEGDEDQDSRYSGTDSRSPVQQVTAAISAEGEDHRLHYEYTYQGRLYSPISEVAKNQRVKIRTMQDRLKKTKKNDHDVIMVLKSVIVERSGSEITAADIQAMSVGETNLYSKELVERTSMRFSRKKRSL